MEMDMDGRNVQSEIEDHTVTVDIKNNKQDTPQLKRAVEDKLETVLDISEHRCIYRVPKPLRDTNEAAYVPRLVSLGPFHHGNENLKAMEEHKWRCFKSFIKKHHIDLDALLMLVKGHEEEIRGYYADHIALCSDQFVQVILVDAIFVINFLLDANSSNSAIQVRSIYHEDFFGGHVFRDMMLLENQLPLFILKEILNFVTGTEDTSITELLSIIFFFTTHMKEEDSVAKLCNCLCNCHKKEGGSVNCLFNCHMKEGTDHKSDSKDLNRNPSKKEEGLNRYKNARHFVDFRILYYMPAEEMQKGKFENIESISKLHKAGVRFKLESKGNFFDIEFEKGKLIFPRIVVDDSTETIFRNLLAYDQCHHGSSRLSDYFALMGMLIDTADDVQLLVKNGILQNNLDTVQEVSKVFNNLEKELIYDSSSFSYSRQCIQINEYCKNPRHGWMAGLKQNYLNTPWKVISVIAASILIVLTMIQTVCSVISL